MRKYLVVGDLHLNDRERDRYRHAFQEQLRYLAKKEDVTQIIILGDLTEEKDRHASWLVNQIVEHMTTLARIAPVTILRGNHDYADISSPFFEFLGKIDRVTWIGDPKPHLHECLFLPHTRDYARDWAGLDFTKYRWIFAHNTFDGAYGENGRQMSGIPPSIFPDGCTVISGDVHMPQDVGPVKYVGAPYHVDFGDNFKSRTLVVSTEFEQIESLYYHGPQKRLIEMAWPSKAVTIDRELATLDEAFGKKVNKGDVVKIRVALSREQYDRWQSISDTIKKWTEARNLMCAVVPEMRDGACEGVATTREIARKLDEKFMVEYVNRQGVDKRTLKTGLILKKGAP